MQEDPEESVTPVLWFSGGVVSSDEDIDVVHNHVVDKWIGSNDIQGGEQDQEVREDTNVGSVARLSEGSL